MEPHPILLAPTLLCENSLSMDLYAENLITEFLAMSDAPQWKSISPSTRPSSTKTFRYLLRNVAYPLVVRMSPKESILHVLDHSNGHLCRHHPRSVVTCHDIAEYRETALNSRQLNHWKWRVEGMKAAHRIIAISHHTKKDVLDLLDIPEDRVEVAHYGVDPLFKSWDRASLEGRFPELDRPGLKILHIGSNIQRKNIPVLIRALGILKSRKVDFSLIKVGQDFPPEQKEMIRAVGIQDQIVFLGNRATSELPMIYSMCDVFVFPSTYEGFGRPILEAQGCGTPVILAESSCLPEVGGIGALYFPPKDPEALAGRIMEIQDSSVRDGLISAGFENTRRFNWRSHAEKVIGVYRSIS